MGKPESQILRTRLENTDEIFRDNGIRNSRLETEVLFCAVLRVKRLNLYTDEINLGNDQLDTINDWIKRRLAGEPLAYIVGSAVFYGLEFKVDKSVLIPRAETELLVEKVLNVIKDNGLSKPVIADIGTGCGNIAISLTKQLSSCKIIATDISGLSLKVAGENAEKYGFEGKITFSKGDLFKPLEGFKEQIDVIVSNPPYVSACELNKLQREVREEPLLALAGGRNGLLFYRKIIKEAHLFLKPLGFLVLELGKGRLEGVNKMLLSAGHYRKTEIFKDYNGIDRIIVCQKIK